MQITKDKLQIILDNAPAGSDKAEVLKGLYDRGVTVQGVDSYDAQRFFNEYESNKLKTQYEEREQQRLTEQPEDTNLGTGFTPTFESADDDPIVVDVAKTIGNIPKSGYMLGKDIWTAVSNPIQTAKTIKTLVEGASANVAQNTLENTNWGQNIIESINNSRIERGLPELERNEEGKLMLPETEASAVADQVGAYYRDRYGSWKNFRESMVEDPVGVLGDVSAVLTAGGGAVTRLGTVSKIGALDDAGRLISRAGDITEPTTAVTRSIGATVEGVSNTLPGRMISEGAPTPGRFAEGEVVRALDLTQGDVARITQTTGNNVTDFVARNNLLKETPEQIAMALDDFKSQQYGTVRSEVAKVTTTYNATEVPRVRDALNTVKEGIDNIPGLEERVAEVNRLLDQDTYSLSDVQRVKEILDASTNIYTRAGDVRSSRIAEGLAEVRSDLRKLIEDEVSKATDGQTNIRQLNNDVATARELSDAIELRSTRDLTRQYNPLTSTLLGGATFAGTGSIYAAIGVGVASKLIQTPSFRIALAKTLNATPAEDLARWSKEIAEGNLSPETIRGLRTVVETARENAQFIEAGSQAVTEATVEPTGEQQ